MGKVKENPIKVYARVRPLTRREIERDEDVVLQTYYDNLKKIKIADRRHLYESTYIFDRVFSADDTNETVFKYTAKDYITKVLNGTNCSLIAYGQTGSGKTHTLMADGGVTDCVISELFRQIEQDEFHSYRVTCTFVQIYLEKVFDILGADNKLELSVREHPYKGIHVQGLSEHLVYDATGVYELFDKGKEELINAETEMEHLSSRSHSIFQLSIKKSHDLDTFNNPQGIDENVYSSTEIPQQLEDFEKGSIIEGKIAICDLAGSERFGSNIVQRTIQNQAKYINSSLLQLGNVIYALSDKKERRHIPFRNSTLTRLLQECLGSKCTTAFIICVAPSCKDIHETVCSLNFGTRARAITNRVRIVNGRTNQKCITKKLSSKIFHLENELRKTSCSQELVDEITQTESFGEAFSIRSYIDMINRSLELSGLLDVIVESIRNDEVESKSTKGNSQHCLSKKTIGNSKQKIVNDEESEFEVNLHDKEAQFEVNLHGEEAQFEVNLYDEEAQFEVNLHDKEAEFEVNLHDEEAEFEINLHEEEAQFDVNLHDEEAQFEVNLYDEEAQFELNLHDKEAEFEVNLHDEEAQFKFNLHDKEAEFEVNLHDEEAQFEVNLHDKEAEFEVNLHDEEAEFEVNLHDEEAEFEVNLHDEEAEFEVNLHDEEAEFEVNLHDKEAKSEINLHDEDDLVNGRITRKTNQEFTKNNVHQPDTGFESNNSSCHQSDHLEQDIESESSNDLSEQIEDFDVNDNCIHDNKIIVNNGIDSDDYNYGSHNNKVDEKCLDKNEETISIFVVTTKYILRMLSELQNNLRQLDSCQSEEIFMTVDRCRLRIESFQDKILLADITNKKCLKFFERANLSISELCGDIKYNIKSIVKSMDDIVHVVNSMESKSTAHVWYRNLNDLINTFDNDGQFFSDASFIYYLVFILQLLQTIRISLLYSSKKLKKDQVDFPSKPLICSTSLEDTTVSSTTSGEPIDRIPCIKPNTNKESKSKEDNIANNYLTEKDIARKKNYVCKLHRQPEIKIKHSYLNTSFSDAPNILSNTYPFRSGKPISYRRSFKYETIEKKRKFLECKVRRSKSFGVRENWTPQSRQLVNMYYEIQKKYEEAIDENNILWTNMKNLEDENGIDIERSRFKEEMNIYNSDFKKTEDTLLATKRELLRYTRILEHAENVLRHSENDITCLENLLEDRNETVTSLEERKQKMIERKEFHIGQNKKMEEIRQGIILYQHIFESCITLSEELLNLSCDIDKKIQHGSKSFENIKDLEIEVYRLMESNIRYESVLNDICNNVKDSLSAIDNMHKMTIHNKNIHRNQPIDVPNVHENTRSIACSNRNQANDTSKENTKNNTLTHKNQAQDSIKDNEKTKTNFHQTCKNQVNNYPKDHHEKMKNNTLTKTDTSKLTEIMLLCDEETIQTILVDDLRSSTDKNYIMLKDIKMSAMIKQLLRDKSKLEDTICSMKDQLEQQDVDIVQNKRKIELFVNELGKLDQQLDGGAGQPQYCYDFSMLKTGSRYTTFPRAHEHIEIISVPGMCYEKFTFYLHYYTNGLPPPRPQPVKIEPPEGTRMILVEELDDLKSEIDFYKRKCKEIEMQYSKLNTCLEQDLSATNKSLMCKIDYLKHVNSIIEKENREIKSKNLEQKNLVKQLSNENVKIQDQVEVCRHQSMQIHAKTDISRLQLEKKLSKYNDKLDYLENYIASIVDRKEALRQHFDDSGLPNEDSDNYAESITS